MVKGQTSPESGFWCFFPPVGAWRCQQTVSCSDVISVSRRRPSVAAPHPSCGALDAWATSAETSAGAATEPCLRALMLSASKVGRNAPAVSREGQARGRRRPRRPWATRAATHRRASGGPITGKGLRGR